MAATEVEAGEGGEPSCQIRYIRKQVRRSHCLGGPVVRLANQDELEEVGSNILIHNFIVISLSRSFQ